MDTGEGLVFGWKAMQCDFSFALLQTLTPAGQQQLGGLGHYRIWFPQQQGVQTQRGERRSCQRLKKYPESYSGQSSVA